MIYSIEVKDHQNTPCHWWPKVEGLKRRKFFKFGPGLNILWGRNGTGKSTLLSSLAKYFHCEQGGRSIVTYTSTRNLTPFRKPVRDGLVIDHDGQPVFYVNPDKAIGLHGGHFDEDFFSEGLANTMLRASSGQTTVARMAMIAPAEYHEIEYRVESKEEIKQLLMPSGEKGPKTILLDEPDRSLDLDNAKELWDKLTEAANHVQVIVATHSLFALKLKAKYIELGDKGYLNRCRKLIGEL